MNYLLIFAIILSFFVTYLTLPYWIKGAHRRGFVGKDVHKKGVKKVAECGGIAVVMGTCAGILFYIAINTFVFNTGKENLIYIFAIISTLLIATVVGMIDDLWGWKKGLSKKTRLFIVLFAAVPLMVINAGTSSMSLPFFGTVNLGLFYPLFLIPLGVVGATTTYNFLAGYNGLEASQGILILSALSLVAYITEVKWLSIIGLLMAASLIAFYMFNKYPAKIFPGDVLTYSVGVMIAIMAILGNMEKIAVFFFTPYIIETILKSRGKLKKESFAKVKKDGSLEMPYKKIYSITHLSLYLLKRFRKDGKVYEKEVVYLINGFQLVIILLGFVFVL